MDVHKGDGTDGLQSTPLVIGGVMYLITPHTEVFALDAATGHVLWQYKPPVPRSARGGGQAFALNRGVAIAEGKVIFGSTDNFLVASIRSPAEKFGGWPWTTWVSAAATFLQRL